MASQDKISVVVVFVECSLLLHNVPVVYGFISKFFTKVPFQKGPFVLDRVAASTNISFLDHYQGQEVAQAAACSIKRL